MQLVSVWEEDRCILLQRVLIAGERKGGGDARRCLRGTCMCVEVRDDPGGEHKLLMSSRY